MLSEGARVVNKTNRMSEQLKKETNMADTGEMAGSFLYQYRYWIILFVAVAVAFGIWYYMKTRNASYAEELGNMRREYRMRAEDFAHRRAKELALQLMGEEQAARSELNSELRTRQGIRHDLGDPGLEPGLAATHDFETPEDERATSAGTSVPTEVDQLGSTAPYDVEQVLEGADDGNAGERLRRRGRRVVEGTV